MRRIDSISFQSRKLKSLTPAIKKKQEDLKLLTEKIILSKKEDEKIKEELSARKLDLDDTKQLISKELLDLKRKKNLLEAEIKKLEQDYNKKKDSFSGNIIKKRSGLDISKKKTKELEQQITILEMELSVFEVDKQELEESITELKEIEKTTKKITDKEYKTYKELVINNGKEEKKLDKKLEEVSLREAADRKLHNTLVMHVRRINRIYQKLGKDRLVITI